MTNTPGDTLCPVCGHDIETEAWLLDTPCHEICSVCGIHFGYHDGIFSMDQDAGRRLHEEWRAQWVKDGMPWRKTSGEIPPKGWDPEAQLRRMLERDEAAKEAGD